MRAQILCMIIATILAFGSVAPAEAQSIAERRAKKQTMPQDVYDMLIVIVIAKAIGDNCPVYFFSQHRRDQAIGKVIRELVKRDITPHDAKAMVRKVPSARIDASVAAFAKKYRITPGNVIQICKAGEAEIANKSGIGQLLRVQR